MGYTAKAIKGVGWLGVLQISTRALSILKYYFIAQILTPLDFGIFAVVMLVLTLFDSLTETGIPFFLIVHTNNDDDYVSAAWVVSIFRGFLIASLIFLLAHPIAVFFHNTSLTSYITIGSLIPAIKGFVNPSVVTFQKELQYKQEVMYRSTLTLIDFIFSMGLLFILKSPYALVIAIACSTFIEVFISFVVVKTIPSFRVDLHKIVKIAHFSKWITVIGVSNFFARQLDSAVVGRMLGTETLGVYSFSQRFSYQIITELGDLYTKVTLPIFAKIKDNRAQTYRAFAKTLFVSISSFGFVTVIVIVFSSTFLNLFFEPEWLSALQPMKWFALLGFFTAIMSVITGFLLVHNKQSTTALMVIVRLVFIAILIIPATNAFGIIGASASSLVSYMLSIPIAVVGVAQILLLKRHETHENRTIS